MQNDHYYVDDESGQLIDVSDISGDPIDVSTADFITGDGPEQGGIVTPAAVVKKPAVVPNAALQALQRAQIARMQAQGRLTTVKPAVDPRVAAAARQAAAKMKTIKTVSGGLNPADKIKFIDVFAGCGLLQSSPEIPPTSAFQVTERLRALELVFQRYPYPVTTKTATESSGTATINTDAADIVAGATTLLYPYIIVAIGASALQGVVASVITVTFTGKNQDGVVFTTGNLQFEFTDLMKGIKFALTPWVKVSGTPRPILPALTATDTETSLVVSGLPSGARVSLLFPGTNHESVLRFIAAARM